MRIISTQTITYNDVDDAHPDDYITAELWSDGSVSLKDLENQNGVFIALEELLDLCLEMRKNLEVHREVTRFNETWKSL